MGRHSTTKSKPLKRLSPATEPLPARSGARSKHTGKPRNALESAEQPWKQPPAGCQWRGAVLVEQCST
eukprot:14371806-Alexandrium_andersonii.AAC.1